MIGLHVFGMHKLSLLIALGYQVDAQDNEKQQRDLQTKAESQVAK